MQGGDGILGRVHAGYAAALRCAQAQLPGDAVWRALDGVGAEVRAGVAVPRPPPNQAAHVLDPLWGHDPVAAALLRAGAPGQKGRARRAVLHQRFNAAPTLWYTPAVAGGPLPAR